jgi:transcription antitermination protein NusB
MPSRRKSRQRALQILFQWDARRQQSVEGINVNTAIDAYYDTLYEEEKPGREPFVDQLVAGVIENLPEVDDKITRHAENWRLERMPSVDRNILRLAVYEMTRVGTPAPVVIDEALELARRFSNEESVQFVNGVLDAIHREAAATGPTAP